MKLGPRRNYHKGRAAIRPAPSRDLLRDCTTGCGTDGSICGTNHFQTERYLFFIFNPRTSRHWIINYSFQSRLGRRTGAGETGGLDINIPIIFTLYISTRLHRTYCFIQVGCHVTIHVPSSSSKLQHQRAATRDPVWPPIEIRIMACWRVEGAAPSPAQAIRS